MEIKFSLVPYRIELIGQTNKTQRQFEFFIRAIAGYFSRNFYDIAEWNCNVFTNYASQFLTKTSIPSYITAFPSKIRSSILGSVMIMLIRNCLTPSNIGTDSPSHPVNIISRDPDVVYKMYMDGGDEWQDVIASYSNRTYKESTSSMRLATSNACDGSFSTPTYWDGYVYRLNRDMGDILGIILESKVKEFECIESIGSYSDLFEFRSCPHPPPD
eukprot:GHVO01043708.1.p1 GENE.GHVO01043708.1~~GHVO01043708.1.p1  ORF type:complete len:215 (+),score=29.62 GHVO01043708.1:163-807(+)